MWRKLYFHNDRFNLGVQRCLMSGIVKIHPETGMIVLKDSAIASAFDTNWLFFGHTTGLRDCYLWHQIMFNHFNLVPEYCRLRCWKVVVKVRNFLEAMQFYNAVLAAPLATGDLMPVHGKVGVDERDYSTGAFNGFIYCDGQEDALERYRQIRELVDVQIPTGRSIDIIVKRSCTEFERSIGPTDQPHWQEMPKDELDLQHHIEDIFKTYQTMTTQPDWLKNKVITRMLSWANTIGDKTWLEYFDSEDFLTVKAVTYHHLATPEVPPASAEAEPHPDDNNPNSTE